MTQNQQSIGAKLVQAVQKEAAMQRPLPLEASAQDGAVNASMKLSDHDRLGHLAQEIKIKVDQAGSASTRTKAEAFAARATYLTERLGHVETDAGGSEILRSTPQTMRGPRSEYFEAKVSDSEVSLQRFKPRESGGGREEVPFHATDDTLARITDDAASVLTTQFQRSSRASKSN